MTDELFTIPVCKSPKMLWMEKHGIRVYHNKEMRQQWIALGGEGELVEKSETEPSARGDTEIEALSALAAKVGIKLWNEV